ncbi:MULTISPECIES: hypothetical protein [Halomonadaceae]|uniref:Uncharacterized protein n=2 Tax=Vreelandella TaxID=3137766 RepID=A0A7Z0LV90_9GAMM|nr:MULTISPECIES: hypothetical protein [Halomonas]NYS79295.1 hypothetical protein [Halomonas glaciei]|tara:strand:- start:2263 stop:3705 length:1443 start_codon:yes stop_codon:yes gene_type:complete
MVITIAFDVKNYIEVSESWPIKIGNTSFHLDRKDNIVNKVCISYQKVEIEKAPKLLKPVEPRKPPTLTINDGGYAILAIKQITNWQTVISGLQIFDLDFDNYEIQFHAENPDEQEHIHINSFRRTQKDALNSACDFEQIGRAFCVSSIEKSRIESSSHFREGRIAYEAGRYVDSYNNMFLFLETRYCDGKTKTAQQVELLTKNNTFIEALKQSISNIQPNNVSQSKHLEGLFNKNISIEEKIKILVLLRGKLRHHSLKNPQRWDPNKQNEYEEAAEFLGSIVGHIVILESLDDIYAPETLNKFRDLSISSGYQTNIKVMTNRLEKEPSLALNISYPTTVISSQLCLTTLRRTLTECERHGQLTDTVNIEAIQSNTELEVFAIEFGIWAYTSLRSIETDIIENAIFCRFEHLQSGIIVKHEFSLPVKDKKISIINAWNLLTLCLDWIEKKDPTTRILSLKLYFNERKTPVLSYRTGPQVTK